MPEGSTIGWGILGPGSIARKFAQALQEAQGAELVAVGSRDLGRARAFASEFGFQQAYGRYEDLAADPRVEAVYVASPHSEHHAHTLLCLAAGKHVLCEKALALNAVQAAEMISEARGRGRILMEAMWTRFLPTIVQAKAMIDAGELGDIRLLQADFGFRAARNPGGRLLNPELGGGTLLDLGIYPISLSSYLFGKPTVITAQGQLGATGVDEELSVILQHSRGAMTVMSTSFVAETPREAVIVGTAGRLRLQTPWWGCSRMVVTQRGKEDRLIVSPARGDGYTPEAEAFMELIRTGQDESPIMPLDESLSIMETMDEIRRQVGVVYPGEKISP